MAQNLESKRKVRQEVTKYKQEKPIYLLIYLCFSVAVSLPFTTATNVTMVSIVFTQGRMAVEGYFWDFQLTGQPMPFHYFVKKN